MDLGLTDKVAIITGASDGIGKAAARRIAAEGGTVMIIARTESTLNAAADELSQNSKGQVIPVVGQPIDRSFSIVQVVSKVELSLCVTNFPCSRV